jgi:hypothetical protein
MKAKRKTYLHCTFPLHPFLVDTFRQRIPYFLPSFILFVCIWQYRIALIQWACWSAAAAAAQMVARFHAQAICLKDAQQTTQHRDYIARPLRASMNAAEANCPAYVQNWAVFSANGNVIETWQNMRAPRGWKFSHAR